MRLLGRTESYIGLSTEVKPSGAGVPIGSDFYETDTGASYIYLESGWRLYIDNFQFPDVAESRRQTPSTAKAINVQIGPGDIISNIPVVLDFGQHQVHEGESFLSQYVDTSLDLATVKIQLTVGAYTNPIQAPHLKIGVSVYNGAALYQLYEGGSSISGGAAMSVYNRHRNMSVPASVMTLKSGVTATGTTLLESEFIAGGSRGSASSEARDEWILKPSTTYIVYLVGLAAGTDAIIHFEWYEDLGV